MVNSGVYGLLLHLWACGISHTEAWERLSEEHKQLYPVKLVEDQFNIWNEEHLLWNQKMLADRSIESLKSTCQLLKSSV